MARASEDLKDKALWITLAQSWVQLGEHVARINPQDGNAAAGEDVLVAQSSD